MRKAVLPVVVLCAVLASGCSAIEQSAARGNTNEKDVLACNAFGRWDIVAKKGQVPDGQLTAAMDTALSHAVDGPLMQDYNLLKQAVTSGSNEKGYLKELQDIGQRCYYLGLINLNGTPTQ